MLFSLATLVAALGIIPETDIQETKVVGSSTVSKFASLAQNQLVESGHNVTIESTGTGGGFILFCSSKDVYLAPVTLASRRIRDDERVACAKQNAGEIEEHVIGRSGIVLIRNIKQKPMSLSKRDLFLALAAITPAGDGDCRMIDNPRRTWRDVRDDLPDAPIEIYGPPPTSGTRASFIDLAIKRGASHDPCMKALKTRDLTAHKKNSETLRTDGVWVDAGENDAVVAAAVRKIPYAIGIVGHPIYEEFMDRVDAVAIEGIAPTRETITNGEYLLSRKLFVYAKKAALAENEDANAFLLELTDDEAVQPGGYLSNAGLIPVDGASVRIIDPVEGY